MGTPYGLEFRKKVVKAYEMGAGSFESVGLAFGIGEATVNRWVSRARKEGSPARRPMGGARRKVVETNQSESVDLATAKRGAAPDATVETTMGEPGEARNGVGFVSLEGEQVETAGSEVAAAECDEGKGAVTGHRKGGSMNGLSELQKQAYIEGAKALKGSDRRLFMARIVKSLGRGGQRQAMREFGWARATIRKGMFELRTGVPIKDNFSARGRKKAEEQLPQLLDHIRQIVDSQSQTDPTFRTTRLYTRLSARVVRQTLIDQFEYTDEELPGEGTIARKLNNMGYRVRAVRKSQPKKNT